MSNSRHQWRALVLVVTLIAVVNLIYPQLLIAADDSTLSKEQIKEFLLNAQILRAKESTKGVTHPYQLTLSDGRITHDASFQGVDEHKKEVRLATGQIELNFVDSYKYNLAAYILAEMIGFDDTMPVYVERKWKDTTGSLSWWLPALMDGQERFLRNIQPPNREQWDRQVYKIRVFNLLVYDTDPNLTNILISKDWKVWRIDFTRAFRLQEDLQIPKDLQRCDRQLFEKLKALDAMELATKTKKYLTDAEVQAATTRRDKIVAHYQKLIDEKGEQAVLY
jgi:hypothetical protein